MISTGREYDRFIIAIVIISIFLLGIYVVQCNKSQTTQRKNQESAMTDRLDFLTRQINQTSQSVKDYMDSAPPENSKTNEKPEKEENLPNPVSSSFMG
mgnify:CR=1 FL=1|tara:strand:+ start:956 stop:1249 length:294 start_codon:yes stop_codon:yes gene_type:complete